MMSDTGRPLAIATDTLGGANAACCTHDASIAVARPSCDAVNTYTPLGTRPSALPMLSFAGSVWCMCPPAVVADLPRSCYGGNHARCGGRAAPRRLAHPPSDGSAAIA